MNKIFYIHKRGIVSMTFAFLITESVIRFGMAKCSKEDNFCKRTGRALARQRLKEFPIIIPRVMTLGFAYENMISNCFQIAHNTFCENNQ